MFRNVGLCCIDFCNLSRFKVLSKLPNAVTATKPLCTVLLKLPFIKTDITVSVVQNVNEKLMNSNIAVQNFTFNCVVWMGFLERKKFRSFLYTAKKLFLIYSLNIWNAIFWVSFHFSKFLFFIFWLPRPAWRQTETRTQETEKTGLLKFLSLRIQRCCILVVTSFQNSTVSGTRHKDIQNVRTFFTWYSWMTVGANRIFYSLQIKHWLLQWVVRKSFLLEKLSTAIFEK